MKFACVSAALIAATLAAAPASAEQAARPAGKDAVAVFAGGCFWCVEDAFDKVPGVTETTSGYTGGHVDNPTYEQVSGEKTGHKESVQVRYDPAKVSYGRLLDIYWHNVDPTDGGGQFCDRGDSYRSVIYTLDPEQRTEAEASKKNVGAKLGKPIATEIAGAAKFYPAEDYHQGYHDKNAVKYKYYKWACGRAQRLEEIWGKPQS